MADLFEQLAERDVPPPPVDFDRLLHSRLNKHLVALHVVEFAFRVVPYGMALLGRAVLGFVQVTLTGRHEVDRKTGPLGDDPQAKGPIG
jgi:hypothetical protein